MIAQASEWRIRGSGWYVRVWKDEDSDSEIAWNAELVLKGSINGTTVYGPDPTTALGALRAAVVAIHESMGKALDGEWAVPGELAAPALDFSEFERQ